MGFDIPEPFCWDESFKVFCDRLDEEHKGLFKGIFDVADNPSCADTLGKLVELVTAHFTTEEGLMTGSGNTYDSDTFQHHKKSHDDFLARLGTLSAPVSKDNINYAMDWLVHHIKGTDFGYKGKLAACPV